MEDPLCPLCDAPADRCFGGKQWRITPAGRPFEYASCEACRLLFCWPKPTNEELASVYESYYGYAWFTQRAWLKKMQAWHRYRRVRNVAQAGHSPGKWLDVGCGHGWFLDQVQRDGWDAYGLEILDEDTLAKLNERELHVQRGTLESNTYKKGEFHVISLWHTLEHVPDPHAALKHIAGLLAPGGVCIVAVPNREARGLARAGVAWGWLQEPFVHIHCFSHKALRSLMPADLEIETVHSRDTWDQQYIMYTRLFMVWSRLCRGLFLAPRWVWNRVGWTWGAHSAERIHRVVYEAGVLATYAGYMLLRPLLRRYERGLRGSELLVVFRKSS